ncbi:MAG: hypothetical protein M3403_04615 [Gemmatimonadota bacterium]|nr:hypothetical protein [Gemmatimonadota bacterium]
MKREQPLKIAVLEEILIFLAIVGISAILWALERNGSDFWREVSKSTMLGYVVRFAAEAITRHRGKPLFRLMPENRAP